MEDAIGMEGEMDSNIEFKSHVPASQRVALEALLFFNSCQARVSDCIANGTALLYTSRGRFAEYDVLIREMPRYLRCRPGSAAPIYPLCKNGPRSGGVPPLESPFRCRPLQSAPDDP